MMRFVVILWLMLTVTLKCAVKWGWNKKFEFCEDKWNVFVQEKNISEERCGNLSLTNGCIEEKNYLLERFRMFSEICPLEGKCWCAKNVVNKMVEWGKRVAIISWSEPENFTCPHKYIKEGEEKSNISSPQSFLIGQHKIPYKHFLYGGKTSTCYVHINVTFACSFFDDNDQTLNVTVGQQLTIDCPPHGYTKCAIYKWGGLTVLGTWLFSNVENALVMGDGRLFFSHVTKANLAFIQQMRGIRCLIKAKGDGSSFNYQKSGVFRFKITGENITSFGPDVQKIPNQEVARGDIVKLRCVAAGYFPSPNPKARHIFVPNHFPLTIVQLPKYRWEKTDLQGKKSQVFHQIDGVALLEYNRVLLIENVKSRNAGIYTCHVTIDKNNIKRTASEETKIVVRDPPLMATRSTSLSFITTAPMVAPQSFRHKEIGSDYVLLEWEGVHSGPIEGYKLSYWYEDGSKTRVKRAVSSCVGEKNACVTFIKNVMTTQYRQGDLQPFKNYTMYLQAYNQIGPGPKSNHIKVSTRKENPGGT
ncbi:uncharacterized protein LOC124435204 [Xenia sp. Carnegie-2017]|uniref:uncharacterized protein LOC124435204 n=1 Tax=Xenia sp. Carnegie-2017 TaxID=2897299 RepID=UPI001F0483F3|nr:uncharacterized protein LOC124435204 [Xenia sp. Carnegie-2017]